MAVSGMVMMGAVILLSPKLALRGGSTRLMVIKIEIHPILNH